jgi:hypothetical protein
MHNRHAWTNRTANGIKREIRVIKNQGAWRFQSKSGDQGGWEYSDEPTLEDLQSFREVLFRKYQRRRASFEDVQWADRELARRRGREQTFHVGAPPGRFESPLKDNGGQDFDRH